jgi:hypothetical protein
MSIKILFELYDEGYTLADIVRELDLTEGDVREMTVKTNKWLVELQLEANAWDSYKRF